MQLPMDGQDTESARAFFMAASRSGDPPKKAPQGSNSEQSTAGQVVQMSQLPGSSRQDQSQV